ncbi:MAG: response regulator transcription factor, partial [Pseudomonadales bacterium]
RQALDLINGLLPLTSSGFYLVGADMRHSGVVLRNLDPAVERDYAENYRDQDPLNPALFVQSDDRVVCIDEQLTETELLQSAYYREFMLPLKHRHVADMFLRRDQDIIAVLTMLREPELGPFSDAELALLRRLQPFIQYSLNTVYLPKRYRERDSVQKTYQLTDRELDVVELIVSGASNKLIARQLALSLATVKTHIQHIFQKVGVSSRTELSALVLRELPG